MPCCLPGEVYQRYLGHGSWVTSSCFSGGGEDAPADPCDPSLPDESLLATVSKDNTARLWRNGVAPGKGFTDSVVHAQAREVSAAAHAKELAVITLPGNTPVNVAAFVHRDVLLLSDSDGKQYQYRVEVSAQGLIGRAWISSC